MYKNKKISVCIAAYNEEKHIKSVIENVPDYVDLIVVVNDASTDSTSKILNSLSNPKLHILNNESNKGVGKSTVLGFLHGIKLGADILVKCDGDGQMDFKYLPELLNPLIDENYDFTKGNRFYNKNLFKNMPKSRIIGNRILTFITKITTGYFKINDSQNGFLAIKAEVFKKLRINKIHNRYIFENSLLFELNLIKAKIKEIPMKAIYGSEESHIKLNSFIPEMILFQLSLIPKRTIYYLRKAKRNKNI